MSCIQALYDHRPCQENTNRGVMVSMVKQALIGFIATAAIAVGWYFLNMQIYSVYNLFNASLATQMGFSIAGSCIFGVLGIGSTCLILHHAKKKLY